MRKRCQECTLTETKPPPTPVDPDLFQLCIDQTILDWCWQARRSEWINSFEKVAPTLESSFQRNWFRILMEGGDEMVGCGLIDRSVTRICWGQGPKGGGWVSLTLFGQGGSKERGVKHKLTDLSSRSHVMSGTKKSCMGLLGQNTGRLKKNWVLSFSGSDMSCWSNLTSRGVFWKQNIMPEPSEHKKNS